LAEGSTDAALTPYHVSRSQLFIRERFGASELSGLDLDRICECIEMTRFPPPKEPAYGPTGTYAGLVRAADFIGQLGDPSYFRKVPALYYEFEQLGMNPKLGYRHPGDMLKGYASFFWKVVRPYLADGIKYLRVTHGGKQWIANLQSHVFEVEHEDGQSPLGRTPGSGS
jgi:plasmid stabilization system protein ParE